VRTKPRLPRKLTLETTRLLLDYTYDIGDRSSQLVSHLAKDVPKSVVSIERWANDWQVTIKIVEQLKSNEFKVSHRINQWFHILNISQPLQELSEELKKNLETGLAESVKQDDIDMIKGVHSYAKGSEHKLKDDSIFDAYASTALSSGCF